MKNSRRALKTSAEKSNQN
jgi:hypothetical protein